MISETFIRRSRLAIVISILISIAGAIAIFALPIQQYPQISPPRSPSPPSIPAPVQK